jgi:hypothetical protein
MRGLRRGRASLIQAMNGPVDPERTLRSKLIGDSFRCSQLVAQLSKQILLPHDVILALDPLRRNPSIAPSTPLPWSVSATTTSTGFAVAQKIRHTSGTILIAFRTLTGASLLELRTRHLPEASQKASPNLSLGTAPTKVSWMSSTDLMKCVCPRMKFVASSLSIRIVAAWPSPCARDGRLSVVFQ